MRPPALAHTQTHTCEDPVSCVKGQRDLPAASRKNTAYTYLFHHHSAHVFAKHLAGHPASHEQRDEHDVPHRCAGQNDRCELICSFQPKN
jgi:hypothetical protein